MHIGAGALISRGLLARIPLTFMQDCIQDMPYAQGKWVHAQLHVHPFVSSCVQLGAMVLLSFFSMKHTDTDRHFLMTNACTLSCTYCATYRHFALDNCDIMVHTVMQSQFSLYHGSSCLLVDGIVLSAGAVCTSHHITVTWGLSCAAPIGANSLFSHCIQKAGFAFTSPGYSFYHWEAKAFDPGPEGSLLLLQALQNAKMGSADDIPLVCMAFILCVHMCITAHCKATQTSPAIMLCRDSD